MSIAKRGLFGIVLLAVLSMHAYQFYSAYHWNTIYRDANNTFIASMYDGDTDLTSLAMRNMARRKVGEKLIIEVIILIPLSATIITMAREYLWKE